MTSSKLDISLVVCVADDKRITKLLDSINYFCEVVIVFNGATDAFVSWIDNYEVNNRFELKKVFIKERNLSKARNVGTKAAKYDKVVFYDTDTVIVGNSLQQYSKYLDKYLIVDGKVRFLDDTFQSKIISYMRGLGLPGYALCPSMGINKKILPYIGNYFFDEDIKWIEDSELNFRIFKADLKIGFIEDETCIHDNLTFKQDLKSGYRYGMGAKTAVKKGLREPGKRGNWFLQKDCFNHSVATGIYCFIWNISKCLGYILTR